MVEHLLAKERVEGPNPLFRSMLSTKDLKWIRRYESNKKKSSHGFIKMIRIYKKMASKARRKGKETYAPYWCAFFDYV